MIALSISHINQTRRRVIQVSYIVKQLAASLLNILKMFRELLCSFTKLHRSFQSSFLEFLFPFHQQSLELGLVINKHSVLFSEICFGVSHRLALLQCFERIKPVLFLITQLHSQIRNRRYHLILQFFCDLRMQHCFFRCKVKQCVDCFLSCVLFIILVLFDIEAMNIHST